MASFLMQQTKRRLRYQFDHFFQLIPNTWYALLYKYMVVTIGTNCKWGNTISRYHFKNYVFQPQSSRQFASLLSGRQQLFLYERNFVASSFPCYSTKKMSSTSPNKLIESKSPYLLQHAHNPVDWYVLKMVHSSFRNKIILILGIHGDSMHFKKPKKKKS